MIDTKQIDKMLQESNQVEYKTFKHIPYSEKVVRAYQELLDTDESKIIKRWRDEWDNVLWWIYWWKVYVIWADTWIWKSTFINQVCNNVSNTWVRVVKYWLEDRLEDIGKEEIFYLVNRELVNDKRQTIDWIWFVNWRYGHTHIEYINRVCEALMKKSIIELDKNKSVWIDDLINLMEEEVKNWAKLFAIDHLHYFEFDRAWERLDIQIQNVMHRINEVARKHNVVVLLVAHYRNNTNWTWSPDPSWFKDWASIKQVANIIIQIERDEEKSYFHITKIRWPIKKCIIETIFNLQTFEYSFKKSSEQLFKENKNFNL